MKRLLLPATVFAGVMAPALRAAQAAPFPPIHQVHNATIPQIATAVIDFLLMLAGSLAIIFIIVGGIRYIISSGSPEAMTKAKHTVTYAVIGVIVILLSYIIVNALNGAGAGLGSLPTALSHWT